MCQGEIEKLCIASQSWHVRKVARLLARPLRASVNRELESTCKTDTDATSFGEFSTLPERKEHAPCPHSNLTPL
jgi:hypothetical protein